MINMNTEFGLSVLFDGFLAAIAAIGFAVISNPPKKAVFIAALLAAVGHACRYYLLHQTPLDLTSSTLIAAFTIGMKHVVRQIDSLSGRGILFPFMMTRLLHRKKAA